MNFSVYPCNKGSKMNSPDNNIHTALHNAQDKKVNIQALGREAHLKSKLHFPPQPDHN